MCVVVVVVVVFAVVAVGDERLRCLCDWLIGDASTTTTTATTTATTTITTARSVAEDGVCWWRPDVCAVVVSVYVCVCELVIVCVGVCVYFVCYYYLNENVFEILLLLYCNEFSSKFIQISGEYVILHAQTSKCNCFNILYCMRMCARVYVIN